MRNIVYALTICLLLTAPTLAQELINRSQAPLLVERSPSMNSERKTNIDLITRGRAVNGTVHLPPSTVVKVKSRSEFDVATTTSRGTSSTPVATKRVYKALFVEVVSGEQKGTTGWVVDSYSEDGRSSGQAFGPVPADFQQQVAAHQNAQQSAASSADLVVTVSRGDRRMQVAGKEILSVSVANVGGVAIKGNVSVTVEADGKVIKTERLRGPFASNGSQYLNVEVSEALVRKNALIVVTVDKENAISEGNESNNTAQVRL